MKLILQILFGAIFVWMIVMTTLTSIEQSIFDSWPGFARNPWAIATLWDAYLGFLTFFVWVYAKERSGLSRVIWFVLIMLLGNIATSFYVLLQLRKLPDGASLSKLLEVNPTHA